MNVPSNPAPDAVIEIRAFDQMTAGERVNHR